MATKKRSLNRSSKIHIGFSIFWVLMVIPTVLYLRNSILWVAFISIYALVVGHVSSYEAANNKAVDDATHLKLNALAKAQADQMRALAELATSEEKKAALLEDVRELLNVVGIEDEA